MNTKKVAELFDMTIDTLRYYERVGIIPPVNRNENGYRDYTVMDLNWVFLAKSLRSAGLSIESMVEFSALAQASGDVSGAQKEILNEQLAEVDQKIEEMMRVRRLLHYKIDTYDDHLAQFQQGPVKEEDIDKLWTMEHFMQSNVSENRKGEKRDYADSEVE